MVWVSDAASPLRRRFMKIMRLESWPRACGPGRDRANILRRTKSSRAPFGACVNPRGELPMQWQTPTAIDFRFGFEITMYVANR